ncbi:MAG: non-homologous end-joining DNA ligase [Vicinamibacterales bacterium]
MPSGSARLVIPEGPGDVTVRAAGRDVRLTNLGKVFWPQLGLTKRDLLQYYADVAALLLPHIQDRPMVMKRYPDGATGEPFFMKRAPSPRPAWIRTCPIDHASKGVIDFPVIDDLPALLWVINLGCIDLNQWYGRTDDPSAPDYLHFDLDPGDGVPFAQVRQSALLVRDMLVALGMKPLAKTTGSRGIHVYVPIVRGPDQKVVWTVAKVLADDVARRHPALMTTAYRLATRPKGRVLVDYNQNAWGRTLASVYSVRPKPLATVSTPVTWDEVAGGIEIEDFHLGNVRERFARLGDLWKPLLSARGRTDLTAFM